MNVPIEYSEQRAKTEANSQAFSQSLDNLDTNSLKEDLNKSIEVGRKKRKQLTLENPEFQIKQEIEDEKQNIKVQTLIRRGVADSLKITDLLKLKISAKDNNNPVHSLFRWCMLILYKENPDMYNWSEFKKQVLEKNGGSDFRNRLGYQSVIHITPLEGEKTKYLLTLKKAIVEQNSKPEELQHVLVKIFDIIEIVYKTHEHAKRINHLVDDLLMQEQKIKQYRDEIDTVNKEIQLAKSNLKNLESKSLNEEIIQE
ncbi:unnamed protein product (macronuclear) [Paramecium tetraurelia]|uniref:Uncharacterized protein n=1 Tax=Paramecium tetraurelia TaxID=5888 RepID=A0BL75_PARTE|nr:uncharacterized protein GSPATT00029924001 [Paramecium tetraurelia]CAK59292.1 unnamed protein product [Paramecium tetraurelia]|eukprot:XP_001426690.1 hypothetical protein (macronuclear) [Paramecium tetraurelia strain d4-2]